MNVLIKHQSPWDLTADRLEDILCQIAGRLSDRVIAAYVFGSCATGTFRPDSDIDLILVTKTKLPFTRRSLDFSDLMEIQPNLDILVYTQEEFDALMREKTGFWARIKQDMKQIV